MRGSQMKTWTRKRGFTLIELLVVIAIIAILAAILFPVFAKARDSAKLAKCQSHIKEAGNAVLMYADDWNGAFPVCIVKDPSTGKAIGGGSYPTGQWVGGNDSKVLPSTDVPPKQLRPCYKYTGKSVYMWQCPSEPKIKESAQDSQKYKDFEYWGNSYPMNAAFGYGTGCPWGNNVLWTLANRKISSLTKPTRVILLGERTIHQFFWAGAMSGDIYRNHDQMAPRVPVCFADGHVGYILMTGDHAVDIAGKTVRTYGLFDKGWALAERGWYDKYPDVGAPAGF